MPRKSRPSQICFADGWSVLSDSSREDEHVKPAQHGGVRANVFLRSIAEEIHGLRGPRIVVHFVEQFPHVPGRSPKLPAVRIAYSGACSSLSRTSFFVLEQIQQQARVNVARPGAHHKSFQRSETHRRVNAFALFDRDHAGAAAEMRNNHAPVGERLRRACAIHA